ncbi:MAG: pyridoxal phosphate-dependent aminotransferase [Flavobacteriales bacterium]|nr:pyridoxal phosphate-dependent aminotransferase [Flavobacteriales bacterium]MBP9079510.1 pyridoxal phosphate-dependent aminotransferase [Flavobacteriales bacterium]
MPSISQKGQAMPSSPIRKLVPFAEAARKRGVEVLHLNIGQPDIHTPEVALKAIRENRLTVVEYSHSAGFESYRKGLASYYQAHHIAVSHEDIIITTGGSEALLFGMMACFNPGDELIIPEPFYANYNAFAIQAGITVVPLRSTIHDGFALPPAAEFEKLITPRTKGILICNPGNPTGALYGRHELETLRDIVKKHDLFLFSDEVYREFCYDGAQHISAMELDGIEQNVVLVDSVSKRYSMCGARIGAFITRNKELLATALKFAQARLSPPTYGQIASEAALLAPKSYFEQVNNEYRQRRNILVDGLNTIPGVVCPKPKGAFYCVAELPIDDADVFCQWLLEKFAHQGHTVMMAPAAGFYAGPGPGKKQVRLAYVLEQDKLKLAVECLREALVQYPQEAMAQPRQALKNP